MPEKSTDPRIDKTVIMSVDDRVFMRCYSGRNYTDATISFECLALMVADGAKVLLALHQKNATFGKDG